MKFDTIVSDGAANGWNNIAGARKYETLVERFFADTELRTVFFHDHLFANSHQQHGMFGALIVEEAGATFYNVRTGDEIIIRMLDGAHEEQHSLNITGMSWKREIADSNSPLEASRTIGISEAFNLQITEPYSSGDYLYYYGGIDDAWLGLWGIIRVYDRARDCLKPLCKKESGILSLPPCPRRNDVVRKYEVAAIQTDLIYNRYGDYDPDGLIFVPLEDVDLALSGKYEPKPLILRANAGDWLEVTLHNVFSPDRPIPYQDYPVVPLDKKHRPSSRVSLNPQFLKYDPAKDSGINIGYNCLEQTVGIGESKKYLWYADKEYGSCLLQSFGDMRNHRHHGLFGAVIIEPVGAEWYKNMSFCREIYEEQAVITAPGVESFREYVLFIQNGIRLLDKKGELIQTAMTAAGFTVIRQPLSFVHIPENGLCSAQ